MKSLKLHITLYFLLIWSFSYAQQFTNYTTKDGLPSNHIYKVAQDANGFIWIATDKGLVKFNGTTFKIFTTRNGLATNDVWGLNATPDGKIWYHSKSVKTGYIENDSIHAFKSDRKDEVLNSTYTYQINNIIILSNGRVSHKLLDNKWQTLIESRYGDKIYNNYLAHKKLSKFSTSIQQDTLTFFDKNNEAIKQFYIKELLIRKHKRGQLTDSLYYWTADNQYKILNLNTLKIFERTFKEELGIDKIQYSRINIVNNQLQISGKGFVGILDDEFHIKNTYLFPENIDAHFGFIDKTQNIWLCTFSNGLYKLPKVKREIKYRLKNQKVNYLTQVNNKIIATVYNKGFYIYQPKNKSFSPFLKEPYYLYEPKYSKELNTEYFISKKRIFKVKNKKEVTFSSNKDFQKQLVYFKGYLYVTSTFGIKQLEVKKLNLRKDFLQYGVNNITVFNNKLLIATTNGLKEFKNDKIETVTFKNKEFNNSILNIHKLSKTEILLNTDGFGAYITDLNTIKQLPKSEYLTINNAFIKKENIWLATNKGILKYSKEKNNYVFRNKIDMSSGLPTNNINDVFIDNNSLLVSTNSGVAILQVKQENISQLLAIYVDNATYNDNKISQTNSTFNYKKNNNLSFKISGINFAEDITNFTYQYKLEPIQKEWITSNSASFSFNNLQPENYTLNLKVANKEKKLAFKIKPLWWQLIWVKTVGYLFLFISVLSLLWWFSKKYQENKNKKLLEEIKLYEIQLRALRSQMNPHFVFNSLSAIQFYINDNDLRTSEKFLVKFSRLIRQFFELSKQQEITLKKEIKLLESYLEIEVLRFKEKLNFSFNIDTNLNLEKLVIPTMLIQPIVENAVNHGIFNKVENGNVYINFSKIDEKSYKVEIIDDGVGFSNTQVKLGDEVKSSSVLKDRIFFLNQSKKWNIDYSTESIFPNEFNKGNKSTFIIKSINL